ncbi:MAG: trehalose-phosphatase [Actinobacteria bacterium]|nr:trehalose-phosphatase [Actinomycetota bacterium]
MDLIAPLAEAPQLSAIVLDVDGTLAPIVPRPEDAGVPAGTRAELERLAARYRLLAFVSGRTGEDARRMVGLDGARYVGVHGLELEPEAERWREPLRNLAAGADWPWGEAEDKGLTLSFHYRQASDQAAALAAAEILADRARGAGLVPRFGRKVLEVRPPVDADKGTAVLQLVSEAGVTRALYAGDDTTDLDAFRGIREAGLELGVCVAVASEEGPRELEERADLVVDGPAGLLALLHRL